MQRCQLLGERYSYISFFKTNNSFSKTSKTIFRYKKSGSPDHREGYGFDNYFHAWAYYQRLIQYRHDKSERHQELSQAET